jgi:hypothetical protein
MITAWYNEQEKSVSKSAMYCLIMAWTLRLRKDHPTVWRTGEEETIS